jgi:hypothetical protein
MRRSNGLTRLLWRVTALLQLLVPSLVSVADARLERDAATARAFSHVEATTGKDCARVHQSDCALCQQLTTPLAKSQKQAPPALATRAELPPIAARVASIAARAERPTLPRAPPAP